MAKQIRYGDFSQFHPEKMVTAELAVVTSGDPNAESGRSVYVCFVPGVVKRLTTYEDFQMELSSVSEEIRSEFTEDITSSIQNALLATTAANNAAEAAQAATTAANNAAEAAMNYVLGDISEKTVTFETATQRAGIESGDSLAVAFGKLAKFCSDIDQHSFNPLANNLTTNTEGYGMDARQGPVIAQKISNVETSVNQLNTNITPEITNINKSSLNSSWSSTVNTPITITKIGHIAVINFGNLTHSGEDNLMCDVSSIIGSVYAYDNDVTGIYIDRGIIYCSKNIYHAILTFAI